MRRKAVRTCTLCLAAAVSLAVAGPAAAGYRSSVIVSGLNSPRGLAFGPDGGLYVAESGFLSATGPETTIRGAQYRYGTTGSITRFAGGVQTRIVTGLASLTAIETGETAGAQDIAFGTGGTGYVVTGLGTDPAVRTGDLAPGGANLGRIFTFDATGTTTGFSDPAAFEAANNPAGGPVDSNPFHIAATGDALLVTDAGSNTLLDVAADGTVSLIATFPGRDIGLGRPSDSVPTGVAVGPDGAFYVAELTGFPFTPGAAQIYRVVPGETPTVFQSGFTNITDLAFGADGSLYVLELDANGLFVPGGGGALRRIGTDGTRTTILDRGLVTPTGLEIGDDGAFYVTNLSAAPGVGQVLRISFVPEPATWAMLVAGFGLVGGAMRRRPAGVQASRP